MVKQVVTMVMVRVSLQEINVITLESCVCYAHIDHYSFECVHTNICELAISNIREDYLHL